MRKFDIFSDNSLVEPITGIDIATALSKPSVLREKI